MLQLYHADFFFLWGYRGLMWQITSLVWTRQFYTGTFLEKVKSSIVLYIKSRFAIMSFSTSNTILALFYSL